MIPTRTVISSLVAKLAGDTNTFQRPSDQLRIVPVAADFVSDENLAFADVDVESAGTVVYTDTNQIYDGAQPSGVIPDGSGYQLIIGNNGMLGWFFFNEESVALRLAGFVLVAIGSELLYASQLLPTPLNLGPFQEWDDFGPFRLRFPFSMWK